MAKDAKYLNIKEAFPKIVYFPLDPTRLGAATFLLSTTTGNPMPVVPQIATILQNLDPTMRLADAHTFAEQVDRSILNERLMATLGAFFGALALVVACLGIFGLLAFSVAQRTREFGIRMALGATRNALTGFVLRDVVVMLAAGSVIGVLVAASLMHIVTRFLYGVTPTVWTVVDYDVSRRTARIRRASRGVCDRNRVACRRGGLCRVHTGPPRVAR